MLPGGLAPSRYSLDELRSAKEADSFLNERILAPDHYLTHLRPRG